MADNIGFTPGAGATIACDDVGGVLYQRMKLTTGVDGSAADVNDNNPLPTTLNGLNFTPSVTNNTTAQLAAATTWSGGVEYAYEYPAAQVTVLCDQPYTVVLNQFLDAGGTQLEASYTFTRAALQPFNENIKIPGDYFQVKVTNNGRVTTTTLNVTVSYGIMETVPTTLTNSGNFKVSIEENNAIVRIQDEQAALLRKIVKLMESQATVDSANRQRVTLDAITGGVALPSVTAITNALPAGTNIIGQVYLAGQQAGIEMSRTAYNTGIRSKLTFS